MNKKSSEISARRRRFRLGVAARDHEMRGGDPVQGFTAVVTDRISCEFGTNMMRSQAIRSQT
jgi:hypothetical protein